MSEIENLFVIAAGITGAYWFLPPVLIYCTQRFRRDMRIQEFDPSSIPNSGVITRFFDDAIEAMEGIGFECLGEFALPDVVPDAQAVVQLYRNVRTRESAMISSVWGVALGMVTQRVQYAEFVCRFDHDDIRLIQTSNISRHGSFPDDPHELTFRLPHVQATVDLYHYHQRLMQRHDPGARRVLRVDDEFHGDAEEFLRQVVLGESFERQVATGYLQRCDNGWRPTAYGAILMTWKELWPVKSIRTASLHHHGKKLAADLDVEFGPLPKW